MCDKMLSWNMCDCWRVISRVDGHESKNTPYVGRKSDALAYAHMMNRKLAKSGTKLKYDVVMSKYNPESDIKLNPAY